MADKACELCGAPKAPRECAECHRSVCKNCVHFIAQDQFRFHPAPPAFTQHGVFCADCFAEKVGPELDRYNEVVERSQQIVIVRASFRGYIPCLKKADRVSEVADDAGRGIAINRLKFLAAWEGYDSIIELEAEHRKIRNHGWEAKVWNARGIFACINHAKFRPPEESL